MRRVEPGENSGMLKPRIDVVEDPQSTSVTCQVEIPGIKKEDVSLLLQNGQLTISGERRPSLPILEDPAATFVAREVKYGKFHRQVSLPSDLMPADISASLADGMLTITWPRTLATAETPKRIEVATD